MLVTLTPITSFLLRRGLEQYIRSFDGSSALLFSPLRPKLLRLVLPDYHKHVRPETHGATNDALRNLALEDGTVVVAPPNNPVLDFATSRATWFMTKAGFGSPTVETSEFATLLLELDLAQKEKGELVMKDQDTQKVTQITVHQRE